MPRSVAEILDLFELERIDHAHFRGRQPEVTRLSKVYGGQVVAQALRAAVHTVPDDRNVHSVHGQFLVGGDTRTPIAYEVEILRDGRAFSSRRVVARQHGRTIFHLTASFQRTESGFEHAPEMPAVPPPAGTPTLVEVMKGIDPSSADLWREEWSALDIRYLEVSTATAERRSVPAAQRAWIRPTEPIPEDGILRTCMLAYLSDLGLLSTSLAPHGFPCWAPGFPRASLDHTIWFHSPAPSADWMLFDQSSEWAGGARGLSTGRVFDATGRSVASLAQEGLIRPY